MLLYDFASNFSIKGEILEIGSGCGIIGILLKRDFPKINLNLLEILKENVEICKKNCEENKILASIISADFRDYECEKKFDFIISNPPFYRSNITKSQDKFLNFAKNSENLPFEIFVKNANKILKPNGSLIFCYKADKIDEIFEILKTFKFKITTIKFCHSKKNKSANLILIKAQKSSKSLVEILPPIFIMKGKNFTKKMDLIYKKADVFSEDL